MQRMQRQFGKLLPRTADDAQVGMLIKDFEEADQMLDTVGFSQILTRSSANWVSLAHRRSKGMATGLGRHPQPSVCHAHRFRNPLFYNCRQRWQRS